MRRFDFPVIDADGHVQELNIDWAARIAPAVRERAPRVSDRFTPEGSCRSACHSSQSWCDRRGHQR